MFALHLLHHATPRVVLCTAFSLDARASSADLVSSPWTDLVELDKTEFFWGAYTKLDNFYAISEPLSEDKIPSARTCKASAT